MGAFQSSGADEGQQLLDDLYRRIIAERLPQEGQVSGGFDGDDSAAIKKLADVGTHSAALMSKAKQELIKIIASELASGLGIPKVSPKGKSIDQIIDDLIKFLPDPRKVKGNKLTWSASEEKQVRACRAIAEIFNKHVGHEVISLKEPTGKICEKAIEMIFALFGGFHAEFSRVRIDVERILKNIDALQQILEMNFNLIDGKVASATEDSVIGTETAVLRDFHREVLEEARRQSTLLKEMLDVVIKPADLDLLKAKEDLGDLKSLVNKIRAYPGTKPFGAKVSYLISGFKPLAVAARSVQEALDKLGISKQEYAKLRDPKALRDFLSEKTMKYLKDAGEVELEAYEKAKKALFNQQYQHDQVVEELGKAKHGGDEPAMASVEVGPMVSGGAKLDKRVKKRQDLMKALLESFATRLDVILDSILIAAQGVGEGVGAGTIPLSDTLEDFPKALELLPDLNRGGTYFSLAGFHNDIKSREEREKFTSIIRNLISVLDKLIKDKDYSKVGQLRDMRRGFEEVIKLIDDYSTKFTEGFGTLKLRRAKKGAGEGGCIGGEQLGILPTAARTINWDLISKEIGSTITRALQATPDMGQSVLNAIRARQGAGEEGQDEESPRCGTCVMTSKDANRMYEGIKGAAEGGEMTAEVMETVIGGNYSSPKVSRTAYQLNKLKDTILYYFRTARIRVNLAKMSSEMKEYGVDYVKILADAVAASVDSCIRAKKAFAVEVEDKESVLYKSFLPPGQPEKEVYGAKERMTRFVAMRNKMFDVKIEMYRTAEAVDLYMRAFADGIAANPDSIRNLMAILNGTEVISAWFTERSGDMLCQVFDTFPGVLVGAEPRFSNLPENTARSPAISTYHYYLRVAAVCRLGDPAAIHQSEPEFVKAGVVDWNAWQTSVKIDPSKAAASVNPNTATGASLPGNPFLGIPSVGEVNTNTAETAIKFAEKAMNVTLLKNIISMFVSVGDKFGGVDLFSKTHMSAIQIYKNLMDYITWGAFTMGTRDVKPAVAGGAADASVDSVFIPHGIDGHLGGLDRAGTSLQSGSVGLGLTGSNNLVVNDNLDPNAASLRRKSYVAMRGVGEFDQKTGGSPFNDDLRDTDLMFTLVIKSIVAKVLTTIGVYNMFNRPINKNGLGYFSGLRFILGGAGEEVPKVIPEALELYVRLPLLAEFYRKIFNFETLDDQDAFRAISLVPEMDGVFSGLISIIFDRARYVENGLYSETDIRQIIEEINKIWLRFRDRKNLTTEVIAEFVAEVNRRYGVYERGERERYLRERSERYAERYQAPEDVTNFALSTIDEDDTYPRPAPSMSYQTEAGLTTRRDHKYKLDPTTHMMYIGKLRGEIDRLFKTAQHNFDENLSTLDKRITFDHMLRARREELHYAKTDREKFDIIHTAINSLGQFAMSALEKSLIMFHETVVAPLNTLNAMYTMLLTFFTRINEIYAAVVQVEKWANQPAFSLQAQGALTGDAVLFDKAAVARFLFGTHLPADVCAHERQGLASGGPDLTYQDLQTYISGGADLASRRDAGMRFALDQSKILLETLELLYGHASTLDHLVDMKIEVAQRNNGEPCAIGIQLDHSKLHQYITEVFNGVKQAIDKFRGLLPNEILEKYEAFSLGAGENAGSLYSLEKHLIDELLEGKRVEQVAGSPPESLDRTNAKIKKILDFLSRKWSVDASAIAPGAAASNPMVAYHEFDREVYRVIFYNPWETSEMFAPGRVHVISRANMDDSYNATNHPGLLKLLFNTSGRDKAGVAKEKRWDKGILRVSGDLYSPVSGGLGDTRRSIWVMFNRLVAGYLTQMYDDASGKIYIATLNNFANGAYSSAIFGDSNFDDGRVVVTNDLLDPARSSAPTDRRAGVLARSLARIIRQLMTEMSHQGDKKQFLEADLNEIPLYVKERMKSSLPIFEKMFAYLVKKCDLVKALLRALNVQQPLGLVSSPGQIGSAPATPRAENEGRLTAMLDQIIGGCNSLIQCCRETLGELADDPRYFETHGGFIENYESSNGRLPFMPLSSVLILLKNYPEGSELAKISLPVYKLGDDRFKLQYGTREILNRPDVKLDHLPGMINILKEHNHSSDAKYHFDERELGKSINSHLELMRYLVNAKRYRGALSLFDAKLDAALGAGTRSYSHVGVDLFTGDEEKLAFALRSNTSLADVIRLTESTYQREQRRKIVALVEASDPCELLGSRDDMLVYNIIDMNIVPINIHALQREIPMVNLYNYSWTFDRLITDVCGLGELSNVDIITPAQAGSAHELLGRLLVNPYAGVQNEVYDRVVSKMIRGSTGIEGLGRPKYLGDEIYNKALFGELYPGEVFEEEGGPPAGNAHLRGKQEVVLDLEHVGSRYREFVARVLPEILRVFLSGGSYYTVPQNVIDAAMAPAFLKTIIDNMIDASGQIIHGSVTHTQRGAYRQQLAPLVVAPGAVVASDAGSDVDKVVVMAMALVRIMSSRIFMDQVFNDIRSVISGPADSTVSDKKIKDAVSRYDARSAVGSMMEAVSSSFDGSLRGSPQWKDTLIGFEAKIEGPATAAGGPTEPIPAFVQVATLPNGLPAEVKGAIMAAYKGMCQVTRGNMMAAESRHRSYFDGGLHYLRADQKTGEGSIAHVDVGEYKSVLQFYGQMRFNTVLVRNLMWLTNMQRVLRWKLYRDLLWFDQKVISDHAVTAPAVTELFGNSIQRRGFPDQMRHYADQMR
jgi:hypothetical protein